MKSVILATLMCLGSLQVFAAQLTEKSQIKLRVVAESLNLEDYSFTFSASCQKHRGLRNPVSCGSQVANVVANTDGVVEVPAIISDGSWYSGDLENWTVSVSMHPKAIPSKYTFGLSARGTDEIREFYSGSTETSVLLLKAAELKVELDGKDLTEYAELLRVPEAYITYRLRRPYAGKAEPRVLAVEFQNKEITYGRPGYLVAGPLKDFVKFQIPETVIGRVKGDLNDFEVTVRFEVSKDTAFVARQLFNPVSEGLQQLKSVKLVKIK